jgi:three-Cys-motif partner protein
MSGRDLHRDPFDEGTQDKLDLYRGYLREWLPVFLNQPSISTINIFDFFAGPGSDVDGKPGSPIIAHQEICSALKIHKSAHKPDIHLYLNELDPKKFAKLTEWAQQLSQHYDSVHIHTEQMDFIKVFHEWHAIARQTRTANLLFIDQYGVKFVSPEIFKIITQLRFTDFLFYISSSMINRFREEDSIRRYIPVTEDDLKQMNSTNVHRIVTEVYNRFIPSETEYYLAPFSIKKSANVYGLIFGSRHPLGMDKFLRECWKKDELRGEANFDIDTECIDPSMRPLFPGMDKPKKLAQFENELTSAIIAQRLKTKTDIYIFALKRGFLGKHAKKVITDMISAKQLPKQSLHISIEAWQKGNPVQIRYLEGAQP